MGRLTIWVVLGLTLTFLIGPFIIIIFAGASAGESLAFPPHGLSLRWYLKVFTIESFRASFLLSLFLAIFGTIIFSDLAEIAAKLFLISRCQILLIADDDDEMVEPALIYCSRIVFRQISFHIDAQYFGTTGI